MEISCSNCVLRPLVASDAISLATHANDRDVWLNLRDRFPHPYTVRDAERYIASLDAEERPTSFGVVIDGEAAGTIGLVPGEDIARRTAEVGYWLGRRFWGRGVVTEALRAVTDHAFAELDMHRVFAVPFVHNAASRRVLEKAGYVLEGRMRRSALKAGEILDQWLYATYDDHSRPEPTG
jgi:RimJ/RimL family protein N-acetyltransferase